MTKGSERKPQPGMPPAEPKWLAVPILPELREILAATPSGHLTYLATKFGKPFSVAGLGNWFRDQCNAAGLPPIGPHTASGSAARLMLPKQVQPSTS